jgi:hypothetical protein
VTLKNPRPPDLSPAEAETQRRFDALPRAAAPRWGGSEGRARTESPAGPRGPFFGAWFRPLAAAAAVLVALAVPAQTGGAPSTPGTPVAHDAHFEVAVVDDPSVPMLHGLETFDQLACLTDPSGVGTTGAGGR